MQQENENLGILNEDLCVLQNLWWYRSAQGTRMKWIKTRLRIYRFRQYPVWQQKCGQQCNNKIALALVDSACHRNQNTHMCSSRMYLCQNDVEACVEGVVNSNLEVGCEDLDTSWARGHCVVLRGQECLVYCNLAILACALLVLRSGVLKTMCQDMLPSCCNAETI